MMRKYHDELMNKRSERKFVAFLRVGRRASFSIIPFYLAHKKCSYRHHRHRHSNEKTKNYR